VSSSLFVIGNPEELIIGYYVVKMVVIVDPHLKRVSTYPVYSESQSRDVLIKNSQGNEYEGWCWSGSSAWVDFFNPDSWDWWKGLYRLKDVKGIDGWRWEKSTENVHIWNDMNEVRLVLPPRLPDKSISLMMCCKTALSVQRT
jgi:alpha 1,3-glucosidase